jgi:hypothetical protein
MGRTMSEPVRRGSKSKPPKPPTVTLTLRDGQRIEVPRHGAKYLHGFIWEPPPDEPRKRARDPSQSQRPCLDALLEPKGAASAFDALRFTRAAELIVAEVRQIHAVPQLSQKQLRIHRSKLQKTLDTYCDPAFLQFLRATEHPLVTQQPEQLSELLRHDIILVDRALAQLPAGRGRHRRVDQSGEFPAKLFCVASAMWLIALRYDRWPGSSTRRLRRLCDALWRAATGAQPPGGYEWDKAIRLLLPGTADTPVETDAAAAGVVWAVDARMRVKDLLVLAGFPEGGLNWRK